MVFSQSTILRNEPTARFGALSSPKNPPLLKEIAVNAYKSRLQDSTYQVDFENFYTNDLEIIGYSVKANKDSLIRFQKSILLQEFKPGSPVSSGSMLFSQEPARYFYIQTTGSEKS